MGQGTPVGLSPPCFAGSHPALPPADFSDRIGRTRTTGYEAGEYEMVSGGGTPPAPPALPPWDTPVCHSSRGTPGVTGCSPQPFLTRATCQFQQCRGSSVLGSAQSIPVCPAGSPCPDHTPLGVLRTKITQLRFALQTAGFGQRPGNPHNPQGAWDHPEPPPQL